MILQPTEYTFLCYEEKPEVKSETYVGLVRRQYEAHEKAYGLRTGSLASRVDPSKKPCFGKNCDAILCDGTLIRDEAHFQQLQTKGSSVYKKREFTRDKVLAMMGMHNLPKRRFKDENIKELLHHFKKYHFGKDGKDFDHKSESIIDQDNEQIL